ncbi:hypothetical protein [Chryseobacterium sp. Leaf201]|uniref:hypothetical protein n=1 Tax=Chryseobacterium sp. Leaf201 TaxID=1735672 RepID=UPI0006F9CC1C|nr:hypothetical protein [Chryseobacterium sp. Leaf201]KQM21753.1 hypothetical protein ASE55_18220 [Chryseobacterium sp. Leaf201]
MFGLNYHYIRNDYALNLLDVKLTLRDYKHIKFKTSVLENIISASEINGKYFEIDVPRQIFYKAINVEFELYHLRSKIQLNDFYLSKDISESWKFTTFYYFLFFSNVALHRLLNRGYLYLDQSSATNFSSTLNVFLPYVTKLGSGNWSFKKISETTSTVKIELKQVGSNLHQLVWQDLILTLKHFTTKASTKPGDPEKSILDSIYNNVKGRQGFSPSETRNYLNYMSEVALEEIDNKILCPQNKIDNFIKNLSSFNYVDNLSSKINLSIIVGQYLFIINKKIIDDIQARDKNQFRLLNKDKKNYIS